MTTIPAPGTPTGGGGMAWVRSREGKIVLGAGAVLVVIMLALRRGAGAAGGFTAQPQSGQPDGTIQDQLDQLTGQGGTLSELGGTVSGLAGSVDKLTDLVAAQDPMSSNRGAPLLRATAGRGKIAFSWDPVAGATGYQVRREQSGRLSGISNRDVGLTNYSWAGVKPGGGYGLWVRAVLPEGKYGPWSRLVSPGA